MNTLRDIVSSCKDQEGGNTESCPQELWEQRVVSWAKPAHTELTGASDSQTPGLPLPGWRTQEPWLWAGWQFEEGLATAPVPTLPVSFGVTCPGAMRALWRDVTSAPGKGAREASQGSRGVWALPHSTCAACKFLSKGVTI